MTQGLTESRIVRKLADRVCQRITRRVIKVLQELRDGLLSGDDSCLTNTWDEICVQIQVELSFDWEAYEQTVEQVLAAEVGKLLPYEREAVWLQTPAGDDWDLEDEESRKPEPVYVDDIVEYVKREYVYIEAGRWTNQRIRKFMDQSVGGD